MGDVDPGNRARGMYYGWYLVFGLGLATIVSFGVTQYLFGVLILPIQQETGWSRVQISGAYSAGFLVFGLLGLPVGHLVDRHGGRFLMSLGSLLAIGSLVGLSKIDQVWQLYVLWSGGLGLAMAMTLSGVSFTIIANFFRRQRGRALAILSVLAGLSPSIYIPAAGWLVRHLGWRSALVVLALTVLTVALPIHALVVRRRPEDLGLEPDGESRSTAERPAQVGPTLAVALRSRTIWMLAAATAMYSAAYAVVLTHTVAFLVGRGFDDVFAAEVIGLVGIVGLPGLVAFNLLSDRIGARVPLTLCTALQGLGVVSLLIGSHPAFVFGFVGVYGLGFGAISTLRGATVAEHFGRHAYGSIFGAQQLAGAVAAATGPLVAALLFDKLGDYRIAFALTAAAFLTSALLLAALPRPPYRKSTT